MVQCNEEVTTRQQQASLYDDDGDDNPVGTGSGAASWLANVIADSPNEPGGGSSAGEPSSIIGGGSSGSNSGATPEEKATIKKSVGKFGVAGVQKAVDAAFSDQLDAGKGRGRGGGAIGGAERKKSAGRGIVGSAGGGKKKRKAKPRFLNVTNIYRKAGGR